MNNYPSSPHVSAPHYVPPSHPHHAHHHQPPPPHPMALSMINPMPRTNHIAPDFYSNNVNHGFGHWSPYMRHSQLMPPIHGMSILLTYISWIGAKYSLPKSPVIQFGPGANLSEVF